MRTNLKMILSAMGLVALLASPATAWTGHYYTPSYGYYAPFYGYAPSYGYSGGYYGGGGSYGPYTPSIPSPRYGPSRDFQTGSRG